MKTLYEVLGVGATAERNDIRAAYRQLVKRFHPDVRGSRRHPAGVFEEINAAYAVLMDPQKRKEYDEGLASRVVKKRPFLFREWKPILATFQWLKLLFSGKKVARAAGKADPKLLSMPVEELVKRVLYSGNSFVKLHAVRALFAQKKKTTIPDLLRLLYAPIDESLKVEIIEGLKGRAGDLVKKSVADFYQMEKSLRVRQAIRSHFRESIPS